MNRPDVEGIEKYVALAKQLYLSLGGTDVTEYYDILSLIDYIRHLELNTDRLLCRIAVLENGKSEVADLLDALTDCPIIGTDDTDELQHVEIPETLWDRVHEMFDKYGGKEPK